MTAPKQPPDSDEIKAIGGRPKWDKQSQYIFEVHAGIIAALNGGEKCADVFRSVVGAELHISVGQLLKKLEAGYERERIVLAELDRVTGERDELEVNQRSKNIYHLVAKRDQLQLERDNAINIAHRAKNDLQTECDKNIELQAYLDAAPNVDELLRTMDEQDALDACSLYYINRPGAKEAG